MNPCSKCLNPNGSCVCEWLRNMRLIALRHSENSKILREHGRTAGLEIIKESNKEACSLHFQAVQADRNFEKNREIYCPTLK